MSNFNRVRHNAFTRRSRRQHNKKMAMLQNAVWAFVNLNELQITMVGAHMGSEFTGPIQRAKKLRCIETNSPPYQCKVWNFA